jgi:Tol biopolymer transport system component
MANRTQGWLRTFGWLALAAAGVALGLPAAADAAFPGANGRIAVMSQEYVWPPGPFPIRPPLEPDLVSAKIETVLPDGRERRVLHTFAVGPACGVPPVPGRACFYYGESNELSWSPNGKLLAFENGAGLAVVREDGMGLRRLPQRTERDTQPAWSPDGRRLALIGEYPWCVYAGCGPLYTVRRDGTGLRQVTDKAARSPAWSPTGTIAFQNVDERGLYSVRPDGSRLRRLFGRYWGWGIQPDWSPDGSRIAFVARQHIFTIKANGRGLRRLTRVGLNHSSPAWSPDGKYIAFIHDSDLYVMRSNGTELRRVLDVGYDGENPNAAFTELSSPSWQPLRR